MKFERLLVQEYLGNNKYRCLCDCGNTHDCKGSDMRKGRTKSCGCMNKERELDIVGMKFNKLTVLERLNVNEKKHYLFRCLCDCGIEKVLVGKEVKCGKIKSCGNHNIEAVKKANTKHGDTDTRLYNIYRKMIDRCTRKNNKNYHHYGGRGISVCNEWSEKERGYPRFKEWSLNNGYNEKLSIDRINVNGNYEPSNCRWATAKEQANNTRANNFYTYNNKTLTLAEWAEEHSVTYHGLYKRINKYGYSIEKALTYNVDRIKIIN